jgi:hypothetical protein
LILVHPSTVVLGWYVLGGESSDTSCARRCQMGKRKKIVIMTKTDNFLYQKMAALHYFTFMLNANKDFALLLQTSSLLRIPQALLGEFNYLRCNYGYHCSTHSYLVFTVTYLHLISFIVSNWRTTLSSFSYLDNI